MPAELGATFVHFNSLGTVTPTSLNTATPGSIMRQARVAATIQDQTRPRRSSEQKSASRAVSVPVDQEENTRLESLRSKKSKLLPLDLGDKSPSSLPTVVIARRRKRASSSCAIPKAADCVASTSTSVAGSIANANGQRPRKRQKRASSTPPTPGSSQLPLQPQPRRRPRPRSGSPSTDVEYLPPSRASVRLSRRVQSLIDIRTLDIYTHLADPSGGGDLLNKPSVSVVVPSTPDGTVSSQSTRRPRGHFADESTKNNLIEEWARLRKSQDTLPPSSISGSVCTGKIPLEVNIEDARSVPSVQPETISQRNSADASPAKSQATIIICTSQLQETMDDISPRRPLSTQIDSEKASPVGTDVAGKDPDHGDPTLPSDSGTERLVVPCAETETQSTWIFDSNLDEVSRTGRLAGALETATHPHFLQHPGSLPPVLSASVLQGDSILGEHTELTELSAKKWVEAASPDDSPKDTRSYHHGDIHLDCDEEFYMIDIPELFTLPWVPLSSRLYVPPNLAKLVSGMREQLMMEARARRRAEELYQAELSRRISAEKIIEDLRTALQGRRKTGQEN